MVIIENAPHSDATYKIIGVCMAVHNDIGPGHREMAYQNALTAKFREGGLTFED